MNKYLSPNFESSCQKIIDTATFLNQKGWTPATSSNFSHRLSHEHCVITVSGKQKGYLTPNDVMVVDFNGHPLDEKKPSAETLLHTSLYDYDERINAVLHTHSVNSTVLSILTKKNFWQIEGYELQKAFSGINTHETKVKFPIFENTQDITNLARDVICYLKTDIPCWGYLIRGHGVYTWGESMATALRHLEAIEYLMKCELELIKIRG